MILNPPAQMILNPPAQESQPLPIPRPLPILSTEPILANPFGLRKAYAAFNRFGNAHLTDDH
jgi:hypothetical protein